MSCNNVGSPLIRSRLLDSTRSRGYENGEVGSNDTKKMFQISIVVKVVGESVVTPTF